MQFGVADCSSPDVMAECLLLRDSEVSFIANPQEKRLELALSSQLNLPLDLTVQNGSCKISCEGGFPENCNTTKRHFLSQKVISPLYFQNCSSHYYYCIIAQIGECCSVCTESEYMKDYQPRTFSAPVSSWSITLATIVTIVILAGLGGIIIFLYNIVTGEKTPNSARAGRITHVPLETQQVECEPFRGEVTVLCLYITEENQSFFSGIESLQAFLKDKGFNVVDIYREQESIVQSVYKWAQTHVRDKSTKIILIDTDSLRSLLDYDADILKIRKPVEQAIVYIHSCIPLNNTFSQLFIVRFQDSVLSERRFPDLSYGRCYMYPINLERLAQDLRS